MVPVKTLFSNRKFNNLMKVPASFQNLFLFRVDPCVSAGLRIRKYRYYNKQVRIFVLKLFALTGRRVTWDMLVIS